MITAQKINNQSNKKGAMIPHQPDIVHTLKVTDVDEYSDTMLNMPWQQQLADVIRTPQELLAALALPESLLMSTYQAAKDFPVRVPRAFVSRMVKGHIHDPLLRQVLPLDDEVSQPPTGFVLDPLGEAEANVAPGLVHKYKSRVLLITNGACAVHCRYCFRRHFPYEDNNLSLKQWENSMDYIQQRPEINEIILSGGDPLSSPDARLFKLLDMIEAIPHVTRLRIHTRLPVVIPARITPALVQRLQSSHLKVIFVIHANHANELSSSVALAVQQLTHAHVQVLNQSVLLKGVNDTTEDLIQLSERLFELNVLPYYLHLLDPVIGTHHFHVSQEQAQVLMGNLLLALPGYLVPKLVKEESGQGSKTPIPPLVAPI